MYSTHGLVLARDLDAEELRGDAEHAVQHRGQGEVGAQGLRDISYHISLCELCYII